MLHGHCAFSPHRNLSSYLSWLITGIRKLGVELSLVDAGHLGRAWKATTLVATAFRAFPDAESMSIGK
jgi:hypothetical protein